jgi:hypothetical protein
MVTCMRCMHTEPSTGMDLWASQTHICNNFVYDVLLHPCVAEGMGCNRQVCALQIITFHHCTISCSTDDSGFDP